MYPLFLSSFKPPGTPRVLSASFYLSPSICVAAKYPSIREKKYCWYPEPPIKNPHLALYVHTNIFQPTCVPAALSEIYSYVLLFYVLGFTLNEWDLHCEEGMGKSYWHYTANEKVEKKKRNLWFWEHKAGFFNAWCAFLFILSPNEDIFSDICNFKCYFCPNVTEKKSAKRKRPGSFLNVK